MPKEDATVSGYDSQSSLRHVHVLIPMYEPLEVAICEKCEKVVAEPKELIRIHSRKT